MPRTSQTESPFEIRDPIHGFISLDETERKVIDSRPMQRLKHIHQLAMTYQVYPGATHKRFEHSLGVMELAGRAFDVLTNPANLDPEAIDTFPNISRSESKRTALGYWRRVVRLAALCHDIGHLPFSHAAEDDLLPDGKGHEWLSGELILHNDELCKIWETAIGPINPEHVMKLALGPDKARQFGVNFSNWETLLSGIIADDSLGVDRMDYLLRDSHHLGVAYGRFDVDRLVQSLRILPSFLRPQDASGPSFELGIGYGGIHAAEALLLARYFMFMQVYYHHTRLAYDLHLRAFMREWLTQKFGSVDKDTVLLMNDNDVLTAIATIAQSANPSSLTHADRIHGRNHYKRLRVASANELPADLAEFHRIAEASRREFPGGIDWVVKSVSAPKREVPVKLWSGRIEPLSSLSNVGLMSGEEKPPATLGYIFVTPEMEREARNWLDGFEVETKPR